ncbi:hypothetical protein Tco_0263969 [Tanacetum coccineum]
MTKTQRRYMASSESQTKGFKHSWIILRQKVRTSKAVLRISAFMHGHDCPGLAKKLNEKIPKTIDEIWERVRAFIRRETDVDTTEVIRSPRWEKSVGKAR